MWKGLMGMTSSTKHFDYANHIYLLYRQAMDLVLSVLLYRRSTQIFKPLSTLGFVIPSRYSGISNEEFRERAGQSRVVQKTEVTIDGLH